MSIFSKLFDNYWAWFYLILNFVNILVASFDLGSLHLCILHLHLRNRTKVIISPWRFIASSRARQTVCLTYAKYCRHNIVYFVVNLGRRLIVLLPFIFIHTHFIHSIKCIPKFYFLISITLIQKYAQTWTEKQLILVITIIKIIWKIIDWSKLLFRNCIS